VLRSDKKGGALFYLRSDGQYIQNVTQYNNNKNTAMIVSLTKIYCPSERQQNYFYTVLRSDKKGGALFYLRSDGQYILLGATVMAVCFVD
jgi:GTP cyclohydrolase II